MTQSSKCLVIDTDIASAATERDTIDTRSKDCRVFLLAVRESKHKVVSTETIREEWRRHQSRFTRAWLVSMIAQKKVCFINAPADDGLRLKVYRFATTENKYKAMLKDIHLIEAAFRTDRIVISMDGTVRRYFHEITYRIHDLKLIAWVNPSNSEETPIDWLKNGAALERERLLGYRNEESST